MRADEAQGAPSMQQVADWLEKIGLGQYAQRFAENDIIFGILPDRTDQDLEKDRRCVARSSASAAARHRGVQSRAQAYVFGWLAEAARG
jgi:hypothetical protein